MIFFTVMARCWDPLFLSFGGIVRTYARGLLSLMVVEGGMTIISVESENPTRSLLQRVSFKWTLSSQQLPQTKTAQRKPSLLQPIDA